MKKLGAFCMILLLLLLAAVGSAQETEIVNVEVLSSVDRFQPGSEYALALKVEIAAPYHINSDQPTEDFMVPTTVSFDVEGGLVYSVPEFPPPLVKSLSLSELPLEVYEESAVILTRLAIPSDFSGSQITISGRIEYQACDDVSCLPPAVIEFSQDFPLAGPGEVISSVNQELFQTQTATAQPRRGEFNAEGSFARTVGERGLFITFLLIFLGGLALNLTPCVYPLIPITIGYFGGQAQGRKGGTVAHALLYVLGMAVTYSALGTVAALTGSLFGAALQNPLVLIGIALVLLALALSMFSLYEFRLPTFLTRMAGGSRKGYTGTFLMGLTVGFVAAPCIGPFVLGLLTYVGERGSVPLGFFMFFVLALGLGVPFMFLAVFSGSIDRLPRSGAWMVWVRSIFGFILIAMAIYFLRPLFPDSLLYHAALSMALLAGGIYMAWIEPTKMPGKVFLVIRNLIGLAFFLLALIFGTTGVRGYIDEKLADARVDSGAAVATDGIHWQEFSDDLLRKARESAQPVLIDFYADWCIPCKELDKFSFTDPAVITLSRKFLMLKADLTTASTPQTTRLKQAYEVKGVPTLVFLNSDGNEAGELRVVGFIEKDELLERMKAVH